MKPSDAGKKVLSAQIDSVIWDAFDRMCEDGLETKRSHLERALLLYIDPGYFEFGADYDRLSEKYGIEQ